MTEPCEFCGGPCNPHDMQTWKQVTGWVGGPRKDSMRLREDTNKYAHNHCVEKAQRGQDPKSQPSLEDEPEPAAIGTPDIPDDLFTSVEEVPRVPIVDKSFDYIKPDRGETPF